MLIKYGLENPVINWFYHDEFYNTIKALIPEEWDNEKTRLTLNDLHKEEIILIVGIDYFLF